MQSFVILATLLLVAGASSAEQPQEVSNVPPAPVQNQPSHVVGHTSAVESVGPQPGVGPQQQPFPGGNQAFGFEQQPPNQPGAPHYYSPAGVIQVVGQPGAANEQQQSPVSGAGPKPGFGSAVRQYTAGGPEQYGQPESASIPPNYKPFGSFGLYIGGNPADGYYTNYYKALSNSVADKQQQAAGEQSKPASPQSFVSQASGFGSASGGQQSPAYKQGPFPYPQAAFQPDQGYPYGEYYTPADLNSGSRVYVQNQAAPSSYSSGFVSEYQGAPQPQQQPGQQQSQPAVAFYYPVDSYAASTKKAAPQPFAQKAVQAPASPAKGYAQQQQQQQQQQQFGYAYAAQSAYQSPMAPGAYQSPAGPGAYQSPAGPGAYQSPAAPSAYQSQAAPGAYQSQAAPSAYQSQAAAAAAFQPSSYQAQPQVVAYPVPVGSQIVGSQPGTEGAFQPYGVHGFTRYAVKPTVVGAEQAAYYPSGVHSAPASQFPVYKQQVAGFQQSFYGYPLSQLHYSNGAVVPAFGVQGPSNGPQSPAGSPGAPGSPSFQPVGVQQPGAPQGVEYPGVIANGPGVVVEAASSEKSETSSEADKPQVNKPQK